MQYSVHVLECETTRPFGRQPEHELVAAFEDESAAYLEGRAKYGDDSNDSEIPGRPGYRVTTIPLRRQTSSDKLELDDQQCEIVRDIAKEHGISIDEACRLMVDWFAFLNTQAGGDLNQLRLHH